jgi:ATP-binding cassette subfamily F protein 3
VLGELEAAATLDQMPRLRGLAGAFLFAGDDVDKPVSVLSGGEKARLSLAKILLERPNLLVLDEPTNHLDIQAQDVLARALGEFAGTLLFISHDRAFIDALANKVLEVTRDAGPARTRVIPGGWADYARLLAREEAGAEQAEPLRPPRRAPRDRSRPRSNALRALQGRSAEIESEIAGAEVSLEKLGWLAADPAVARDGERMRALAGERSALEERIGELYAEWERVATQIEEAEEPVTG